MSATMARQGGWVQLEQSYMHLVLNMAKMAKGVFSWAAREETHFLSKKLCPEVWEEKMLGVEFPSHRDVKAAMERHPATVHENQTDGCFLCQNGTAQNPQARWRRKGPGAPWPDQLKHPAPEPTPCPPRMPPRPPGDDQRGHASESEGLPPRYAYIHTPLHSTQLFNLGVYAKDRERNEDFIPDLLTNEGTSTG